VDTSRDSRTGAAGLRSRMERRQDVPAHLRPPVVFPALERLDGVPGEERLAAYTHDRRRVAVDGDPGGLLLVLRPTEARRAERLPGGTHRIDTAGSRRRAGDARPAKHPGAAPGLPSCPKSRKSDSEAQIGRENRVSWRVPRGMAASDMPEITHPGCLKSRTPGRELPEITKQTLQYPQNHVARSSTATRFSVTMARIIDPDPPESASKGQYVILGRTVKIRDLRQKWRQ